MSEPLHQLLLRPPATRDDYVAAAAVCVSEGYGFETLSLPAGVDGPAITFEEAQAQLRP